MAGYYTYKTQVRLKPGEKLGFTPGRGYYAIAAPAKAPAPAKPASTEDLGGLPASQAEQVAGSYGLTTSTNGSQGSEQSTTTPTSKPPTKHATQPTRAPTTAPAKTPIAAKAVQETVTDGLYRPTVFKISAKAQPNAALIEAAHRQGGTVAHPVSAAASTKPSTTNTKKKPTTPAKLVPSATAKPVQTTAPAAKHPTTAATSTYYTYKKDVHLKPGQTLAYTPGKGYYARTAAPTVKSALNASRKAKAAARDAHQPQHIHDAQRRSEASRETRKPPDRKGGSTDTSRRTRTTMRRRALQDALASHSRSMSPDAKAAARETTQALKAPEVKRRATDLYVALLSLGFDRTQASAFLGNFFVESNYTLSATTSQEGGPGRGFAQWSIDQGTAIGRWGLENTFAKQEKAAASSFPTEVDFMVAELSGILPPNTYHYDNFENVRAELAHTSLGEATKVVMLKYEQEPSPTTATIRREEHLDRRQAAAAVVDSTLDAYGQALLSALGQPVLDLLGQLLAQRLKARLG